MSTEPNRSLPRRDALRSMCACAGAALTAPMMSGAALRGLALGAGGAVALGATGTAAAAPSKDSAAPTPDEALQRLKQGNQSFLDGKSQPLADYAARRGQIATSQSPFAVVVACSDSRVPPEVLFGQGLGDVFTVRVAGNTVSPEGLGSIEYAVAELGTPLVVVLGHERCGAVAAAVSIVRDGTNFPGAIGEMVGPILPAAIRARDEKGDWVDNAVRRNVVDVVERLKISGKLLEDPIAAGKLRIVGARYDLDDGKVDFFHT